MERQRLARVNEENGVAIAAARLNEAGWEIDLRLIFPEGDLAELTRKKLDQCGRDHRAPAFSHLIVLDGLLGLVGRRVLLGFGRTWGSGRPLLQFRP